MMLLIFSVRPSFVVNLGTCHSVVFISYLIVIFSLGERHPGVVVPAGSDVQ